MTSRLSSSEKPRDLNFQTTLPSAKSILQADIKPLTLPDNKKVTVSKPPVANSLEKTESQGRNQVGPHADIPKATEPSHQKFSLLTEETAKDSSLQDKTINTKRPSLIQKMGQIFRKVFFKSSAPELDQKEG